jgi:hypothetical protein
MIRTSFVAIIGYLSFGWREMRHIKNFCIGGKTYPKAGLNSNSDIRKNLYFFDPDKDICQNPCFLKINTNCQKWWG